MRLNSWHRGDASYRNEDRSGLFSVVMTVIVGGGFVGTDCCGQPARVVMAVRSNRLNRIYYV